MRVGSSHLSQEAAALAFGRLTVGTLPCGRGYTSAMARGQEIRKGGRHMEGGSYYIHSYIQIY